MALIDFDDIDASAGDVPLNGTGYAGFDWTSIIAYTSAPGFPGYNNGIVSSPNAAFSGGEFFDENPVAIVGVITAPTPFDFTSAWLGAAWYDGLDIIAKGFALGNEIFMQRMTVNTSGAQQFDFNFTGIDALTFVSTATLDTTDPFGCGPANCTQFTMDNLVLTASGSPTPVPEPGAALMLLAAVLVRAFSTWGYRASASPRTRPAPTFTGSSIGASAISVAFPMSPRALS